MEPRKSRLFSEIQQINRYWQLLIISVMVIIAFFCFFLASLTGAFAQSSPSVLERLPAPPPVPIGASASPTEPSQSGNLPPLPPPPSPSSDNASPASQATITPPSVIREYTFQAPDSSTIPISIEPTAAVPQNADLTKPRVIRVEVIGNSQTILAQVKKIEPLAFIQVGKGTIQAGIFPNSKAAQQRIQRLEQQGLSTIISTD